MLILAFASCTTEMSDESSGQYPRRESEYSYGDSVRNSEFTPDTRRVYVNQSLEVWSEDEAVSLLESKFLCADSVYIQEKFSEATTYAIYSEDVLDELELFSFAITSENDTLSLAENLANVGVADVLCYVVNLPSDCGFGIVPGDKDLQSLTCFYNHGHLSSDFFTQSGLCQQYISGETPSFYALSGNINTYHSLSTVDFSIEQLRDLYYIIALETYKKQDECATMYISNLYTPQTCINKSIVNDTILEEDSRFYHIYDLHQGSFFMEQDQINTISYVGSVPLEMFKIAQLYEIEDYQANTLDESRNSIRRIAQLVNTDYNYVHPVTQKTDYQMALGNWGFELQTEILENAAWRNTVQDIIDAFSTCGMVLAFRDNEIYTVFQVDEYNNSCDNSYRLHLGANKWGEEYLSEVVVTNYLEAMQFRFEIYSVPVVF